MPKQRNKQHWNYRNPGFQRNKRQSAQNFQRNMSQDYYNIYCNQKNIPPNASNYNDDLDFQNNYSQNYYNNYYDPSYQRNFNQSYIQSNFNQTHEMNFTQNARNTGLNQNCQRFGRESSSSSINDTIDLSDLRQNDRTKNVKKKSAKTNPWYKKQQTNQKINQQANQQTNQQANQQINQQTNQKTNIINNTPPAQGKKRRPKRNLVAEYYKITENFTEKGYIIKETLYQDPSLFYANDNSNTDLTSNNDANDNKWTDAFWQKHDVSSVLANSKPRKVSRKNQNRLERSLNAMLSKPAEMSKGKSLLQKMGWQGGGLGRDGDGIVEPIAPKATYAVNTLGLGHGTETPKTPVPFANVANKTLRRRPVFQNNFCMNVLLYILEFVKNDEENKIVFEPRLSKLERKKIHQIVEKIRESDNLDDFQNFANFSDKHLEVVKDIWIHNYYELWTESEGETQSRRLCLFKEAPAHVYLVTPEDLTENDECNDKNENFHEEIVPKMETNDQIIIISDSENEVTTNNDINNVIKEENQQSVVKNENNMSEETNICNDIVVKMEINETISDTTTNINIDDAVQPKSEYDEETYDITVKMEINDQDTKNDESVSIKATNIDNNDVVPKLESDNYLDNLAVNDKTDQKNIKESALAKIVKYFKEFSSDETFKEFRFLGPFNSEEIMHINMFFDIFMKQDDIECDEKCELMAVFDNDSVKFNVLEDNNGKRFITKVGDSPELPSEDEDVVYASGVYF